MEQKSLSCRKENCQEEDAEGSRIDINWRFIVGRQISRLLDDFNT